MAVRIIISVIQALCKYGMLVFMSLIAYGFFKVTRDKGISKVEFVLAYLEIFLCTVVIILSLI